MKVEKKPPAFIFPCPVALVTTVNRSGRPNIVTLAWVGVACSEPATLGIAVRPSRYSHKLLKETGEFVVNIPSKKNLREADLCGMVSGKDTDKFARAGFTPEPASKVKPPMIKECPVNLECKVKNTVELGSHTLFLGEVVQVHVDSKTLDTSGKVDFDKLAPFVYLHLQGEYWSLGKKIGTQGLSKI